MRQAAFRVGVATVVASGLLGAGATASGAVPEPSADPFYAPPPGLASSRPGTILRSRAVTAPGVDNASAGYQLLYRTTDAKGRPIATVTTFFVPSEPAPGPRRLMSYFPASDSLSMKCSPSYTLRSGTGQQGPGVGNVGESDDVKAFLQQGWDVAVPDYEGPDSAWAVGPLEGTTALDGIRAVESFAAAELEGARTRVAMGGYSGGSIPTQWAASLATSYAPELNIVAATSGGNLPDPMQALAPLDGSPLFGTVIGVAVGVNRAYPELGLDAILNAKGRALAARDGADADGCGGSVTNAPFGTIAEYSNYPNAEAVLALPNVRRVFAQMKLIDRPAPAAPSLILQSAQDELTPAKPVDEFVAAACAQGATIQYERPPGDHVTGSALIGRYILPYIQDRFAGKPPPSTCPPRAAKPAVARPAVSRLRVKVRGTCCRRPARLRASYTLNTAATVTFRLTRRSAGRRVSAHKAITRSGAAGANRLTFAARLAPGTYELTATPAGGTSQAVRFRRSACRGGCGA